MVASTNSARKLAALALFVFAIASFAPRMPASIASSRPAMTSKSIAATSGLRAAAWQSVSSLPEGLLGYSTYLVNGFVTKFQIGPGVGKAVIKGKKLVVIGDNFDDGALIVLDGESQPTKNNDANPNARLIARKSSKKIAPGQSVMIRVKNPDGMLSLEFRLTRPAQ